MAAAKKVVCIGDRPHEMVEQIKLIVRRKDIEFTEAVGAYKGLEAIRRVKLVALCCQALYDFRNRWGNTGDSAARSSGPKARKAIKTAG